MKKNGSFRALIFLLLISLNAFAQEFTIGVENIQNKPLWWIEGENYQGFSRELLDNFAASKGYTFHYRIYPVKRLYHAFMNGEIDFKFPDHPSWRPDVNKGNRVTYSEALQTTEEGTLVKTSRAGITVKDIKKLGIVRGWTALGFLDEITAGHIKLVESSSLSALIKMCERDRIDAIYTNVTAYHYEARKLGYRTDSMMLEPNLPHQNSQYLLSTITHPQVIDELNRYLKSNPKLVKHFGPHKKINAL